MKTFINLALDTRKVKADGTYSVILRIIHHQLSSQVTLGIYLKEQEWDSEARKIKASYKGTESVTRLNNWLQKKKTAAIDIITKLDEQGTLDTLTVQQIKERIEDKPENTSFFHYAQSRIDALNDSNQIGNARIYKDTMSVLKNFWGQKDLSFSQVNYAFLIKFEVVHIKKGNSYNGLSVYLRTVRAIFNHAIKAGMVQQELYPFKAYEIKSSKTRKRAINVEAIRRIAQLELLPGDPLYHTRNYFLLSFYLRGMSFTDLAHLKVSNVIDGRIYYQRQKTDKPYDIKITEEISVILNLYLENKGKDDFIFPIIDRETLAEQYKDVQWARKRFNKKLKDLAKACNIGEHITSYISRHSFATRAKNLGIPIASISDMLGHESTKTTEVYLDTLPSDLLDEYHAQIIK